MTSEDLVQIDCPICGRQFWSFNPEKWTVNRKVCSRCWKLAKPAFIESLLESLSHFSVNRNDAT